LLYVDVVRTSLEAYASTVCYGDSFTFLYIDDIRTSLEAYASTVFYGDSFTFLYIDDVRTSLEAYASTAYYGDSFTFLYVDDVRTSQETHVWACAACYGDRFTFTLLLCWLLNTEIHFPCECFTAEGPRPLSELAVWGPFSYPLCLTRNTMNVTGLCDSGHIILGLLARSVI
jgi:hypothetical protein